MNALGDSGRVGGGREVEIVGVDAIGSQSCGVGSVREEVGTSIEVGGVGEG